MLYSISGVFVSDTQFPFERKLMPLTVVELQAFASEGCTLLVRGPVVENNDFEVFIGTIGADELTQKGAIWKFRPKSNYVAHEDCEYPFSEITLDTDKGIHLLELRK